MKTWIAVLVTFLGLTPNAFASMHFFDSSDASLGILSKLKCSTGLSCSVSSGKLLVTAGSSTMTMANGETIGNGTDDTVAVASEDNHTTLLVQGFEAKDAILGLYADEGDDTADKFSFKYSASGALTFEVNASAIATMTGSSGNFSLTGDLFGDGGDQFYGFLQNQVASTTTTLTAAQCGSTIVSDSADVVTLPEASTVLGCQYTFVCGTADDFDINPNDGTDQIGPVNSAAGNAVASIAPAAGDAIRCTDIGSSITLEAVGANLWSAIGIGNGAFTDVN